MSAGHARTSSCSVTRTHWCSSGCTQTGSGEARRSLDPSGDERRNPDAEAVGSGLPAGSSGGAPRAGGAQESTRAGAEAAGSSGGALRAEGADEPLGTAAEDADVRRGLKISAELPPDDEARELVRSRGEHLSEDVPIFTPIVQRAEQAAGAADAHMSVGKMEMISSAAAKMTKSAAACELTGAEIWMSAKTAIGWVEHPCQGSQTSSQVTTSIQRQNVTMDNSGTSEQKKTKRDWSKCNKNTEQNS